MPVVLHTIVIDSVDDAVRLRDRLTQKIRAARRDGGRHDIVVGGACEIALYFKRPGNPARRTTTKR